MSLEEQEQIEEEQLINSIKKMNENLKHLNSNKNKTFDNCLKISGTNSNFSKFNTCDTDYFENDLVKQNIDLAEESIKLLLIGDVSCGKTSFIHSILNCNSNNSSENNESSFNVQPTTS